MPIIRLFAKQGHAVPTGVHSPRGPFPPELYQSSPVVYDNYQGDSLHETFDDVSLYRCKECGEVLYEDELDEHECEE
jgi:hypothetical protein